MDGARRGVRPSEKGKTAAKARPDTSVRSILGVTRKGED